MRKVILKFTTLGLLGFSVVATQSQASDQLATLAQLESQLEDRAKKIIYAIDNKAVVIVKVKTKEKNMNLPGLGMREGTDIPVIIESSTINIDVYSALQPFPRDFDSILRRGLRLKSSDIRISYRQIPDSLKTAHADAESAVQEAKDTEIAAASERSRTLVESSTSNIAAQIFPVFVYFCIGVTALALLLTWLLRGGLSSGLASLEKALQALVQNSSKQSSPQEFRESTTKTPRRGEFHSLESKLQNQSKVDAISNLETASLVSLFADAYWCEEDQYASYLWAKLDSPKRSEVIEESPLPQGYYSYISSLDPEELNFHAHPWYLRPALGSATVSNLDLVSALKSSPGFYSAVSPMRKPHLKIPLKARLQWIEASSRSKEMQDLDSILPKTKSPLRILPQSESVIELSLEDEEFLFASIDGMPRNNIDVCQSWVWAKVLRPDERQSIWSDYTAQEIAEALEAPTVFVQWLLAELPKTKSELISAYIQKVAPSKESPIYKEIFSRIRELALKTEEQRKAA